MTGKIAIFILALLLSLAGLEKLFEFALVQNKNIKAAYIQSAKINADIIIHGPCEPHWMVSPEIIRNQTGATAYNLAINHSDFGDNYLHLHLYLKNNNVPRYLFLYVTPESLDEKYNTFHTYRFAPYLEDSLINAVVKEFDHDYYKWKWFPFMKYAYYSKNNDFKVIQGLKHFATGRALPYWADGYEKPERLLWGNHFEDFIHLYASDGVSFKWSERREKYLRKIIDLCRQNNISIYLYESPVLCETLPYQLNRDEFMIRIKNISDEYKIQYLVFDTMKIAESRDYFVSTLNTNLVGSEIFSETFGKYIKEHIIEKDTSK